MNDKPDRLAQLRFLERVQLADLARTQRWIADEERRLAEEQRGRQVRPPQPDWVVEVGLNRNAPPVYVHRGDCHMIGKRARGIDRNQALRVLADGVPACTHCRPDSDLGYLDG